MLPPTSHKLRHHIETVLSRLREDARAKPNALTEADLRSSYRREAWVNATLARCARWQLVTHTLKPIHPVAKGSHIFALPMYESDPGLVGTSTTGHSPYQDIFCLSGAAFIGGAGDLLKFLRSECEGRSVLRLVFEANESLPEALSDDPELGRAWVRAVQSMLSAVSPASHTLAKQIYFPVAGDQYHLLAPLYPSALVHAWHQILQADRWSDEAKAAREARRKRLPSAHGYVEYPGLAVQSFGGTKPHNISQLNAERGGKTHLMSSLPPNWSSPSVRAPMNCASVFDRAFPGRRAVKEMTTALRQFLFEHRGADENNIGIRRTRAEMVENIVGELLAYAAELHALAPHWSRKPECNLRGTQRAWLDPESLSDDDLLDDPDLRTEWPARIANAFANWLNSTLTTKKTAFGDTEAAAWKQALLPHLDSLQKELEAELDEREGQEISHAA